MKRFLLLVLLSTPAFAASPVTIQNSANTDAVTVTNHKLDVNAVVTPGGTQDVNVAQVNGATVNVGVGAASTGTQRVTVSTDSAIIANPTAASYGSSAALASNIVLKNTPGTLYSLDVVADSTLYAAAWYVMVYDATVLPSNGAVTPAKCYAVGAGTPTFGALFPDRGVSLATGVTVGVSTTGCFTQTASIHAFISGEYR